MSRRARYAQRAIAGDRLSAVVPVAIDERASDSPPAAFPQRPGALDWLLGPALSHVHHAEDAWQLTISSPPDAVPGAGMPVLVFLHGGAFISGSGSVRWYGGDALASAIGAVVVSVNYRIGLLGHIGRDGVDDANGPLRDILLALAWVQDNVVRFGGAAEAVTVLGESAGGWYAYALARCPAARGLFDRIGVFSTPGQEPMEADRYIAHRAEALDRIGGLDGFARATIDQVLDVQGGILGSRGGPDPFLMPVVDGELVAPGFFDNPDAATRLHVDRMLLLTVADEAAAFIARPGAPQPPPQALDGVIDQVTRDGFRAPAERIAAGAISNGIAAKLLSFELASPVAGGRSPHGMVLPALFGNVDAWADAPLLQGVDAYALAQATADVQSAVAELVAR